MSDEKKKPYEKPSAVMVADVVEITRAQAGRFDERKERGRLIREAEEKELEEEAAGAKVAVRRAKVDGVVGAVVLAATLNFLVMYTRASIKGDAIGTARWGTAFATMLVVLEARRNDSRWRRKFGRDP